jgi:succinylglutamate desuccinylase
LRYKILTAVLSLFLLRIDASAQEAGNDILTCVREYGQAEVVIVYPGYDAMSQIAARYSVSACDGKEAILSLSPLTAPAFIRTGIPYKIVIPESTKSNFTASSADEAMQWHAYPTWKHYDTIMHRLAVRWPEVCVLDTIGFSVLGRAILALRITDNPSSEEDEPAVMLSASVHGDELGGFVLLMRLAEHLASGSNDGGLLQRLTSGLDIYINPLANPDGMYRNGDTIINPVRTNHNGYDINRNFPDPEVSSPPPLQPETVAMMAYMREKHFVLSANLHAGTEVVNYPWDKWTRAHADDQWFNEVSRRYADTVHLNALPGYLTFLDNGVTRGSVWYSIRGGRQDYITYELGGREVTMELDDTKQTPATQLEALWSFNRRSLLRYLEEALYGVSGIVTDAETGMPVAAKIFAPGHDIDSSHVYSDTLTGRFYRFLSPGVHTLTVSAPGYKTYTAENVNVIWNQRTELNVELTPADTLPVPPLSGLLIFPVPSTGLVRIIPPESVSGNVIVRVTSISGTLVASFITVSLPGIPIYDDFSFLGDGVYIVSVQKLPLGPAVRGKMIVNKFPPR